ncbi:MAG: dihydrofolate reductase family protein, partial [Cyanobacteria bacterium P01_F01_bin.153]
AIIVGSNTVRRDNPYLTSHSDTAHNPLRVVMSRQLDLPKTAESGDPLHLWDTTLADTTVITQTGANPELQAWLRDQGVNVIELDAVTPDAAMKYLGKFGALSVLWECGGTLAAQAIAQGAVQKVLAFIAPKIVGGTTAPLPVGDLGITTMTEALTLERMEIQKIGTDWMITGYLPC